MNILVKLHLYTNIEENMVHLLPGSRRWYTYGCAPNRIEECHQYGGGGQSHLDREWLLS